MFGLSDDGFGISGCAAFLIANTVLSPIYNINKIYKISRFFKNIKYFGVNGFVDMFHIDVYINQYR